MAYFDCQIVQGGGGIILTVTCDSVYAGATITATDGETTLQAACPSSSPYTVEFEIPNSGSWTISGTASGQTGSITVVIPDSATLYPPIPTGSTVTPVNDIQIWLHCADIWNKNYTTIGQVLADASTLQALIANNNAADYMARSTSWASAVAANSNAMTYIGANNYCANKLLANSTWLNAIFNSAYFESVLNVKVPTMTSDTAPSGQVIYSSQQPTGLGWYAFNNDESNGWYTYSKSSNNEYIGYVFPNAVNVKAIYIMNYDNQSYIANNQSIVLTLQGSTNNTNWNDIGTITIDIQRGTKNEKKATLPTNSSKYTYHRLISKSKALWIDGSYIAHFSKVQFYGRA